MTKELLDGTGLAYTTVEYLKTPPTMDDLQTLRTALGRPAHEWMRSKVRCGCVLRLHAMQVVPFSHALALFPGRQGAGLVTGIER